MTKKFPGKWSAKIFAPRLTDSNWVIGSGSNMTDQLTVRSKFTSMVKIAADPLELIRSQFPRNFIQLLRWLINCLTIQMPAQYLTFKVLMWFYVALYAQMNRKDKKLEPSDNDERCRKHLLTVLILNIFLFLNGPSPASFSFIFVFMNKHYNSYNKYMWKKVTSIQYTALEFEPTTFGHESPPITTRSGLPLLSIFLKEKTFNVLSSTVRLSPSLVSARVTNSLVTPEVRTRYFLVWRTTITRWTTKPGSPQATRDRRRVLTTAFFSSTKIEEEMFRLAHFS